jgi:hypothetical protein
MASDGGRGGIRTLEWLAPLLVFKTSAHGFNYSVRDDFEALFGAYDVLVRVGYYIITH